MPNIFISTSNFVANFLEMPSDSRQYLHYPARTHTHKSHTQLKIFAWIVGVTAYFPCEETF